MKVNKTLIESYTIYTKTRAKLWSFVPERQTKKFFGGIRVTPACVWWGFSMGKNHTLETFNKEYSDCLYIEGEKVYYYPNVELKMPSGQVVNKYFKCETALQTWVDVNLGDITLEV